jgi:CHAT domain-containing protein
MFGSVIWLVPAFLLSVSFNPGAPGTPPASIAAVYRDADRLFNLANPTGVTDSMALAGFEKVIANLQQYPGSRYDSLLFQSYLKKGILLDVKNSYEAAKFSYLQALHIPGPANGLSDSLLFRVLIYTGSSYFNLNNFDSANYFLIKAESLTNRYPHLQEKERLYNTLGALNYVNGNYLQSKNYFSQALYLITSKQPVDRVFAAGLQANIATAYFRLGRYPESLAIYDKIVQQPITAGYIYNGIYMNMGRAYAATGRYREALSCFRKIRPAEMPGVLNETGLTYLQLSKTDSAVLYLNRLAGYRPNELDKGINALYRADLLADREQYLPALASLQQAISAFSNDFKNPDIFSNPAAFTGSYTYYRLFDALYKKAVVFSRLYKQKQKDEYLLASFAAYKTTLTLLAFIEKSYDTDDAKLFLKKKSQDVYPAALSVCLRLHALHPGDGYLEQAFLISEKNKASIVAANLQQRDFITVPGIDKKFLQTERNIKFNIARLNVKSEQAQDNESITTAAREKARYEIQLSQLQKNLEQNSRYYKLKYDDDYPGIKKIQQHIGGDQALISFYITPEWLHVFVITATAFNYRQIGDPLLLQKDVEAWLNLLKTTGNGRKFNGRDLGRRLYEQLIKPIQLLSPGKKEWVIIPDGDLYSLPFESLPSGNDGTTLLETTTISYQLSTRFIVNPLTPAASNEGTEKVLAFAPFTGNLNGNAQPEFTALDQLPASGVEIAGLPGQSYTGGSATKTAFLAEVNKYPVVHLATHAFADAANPAASFIAFYPEKKNMTEDRLYLEEIYGLNLDATRLVIISACETGKGQLVNNEGVISLARAFAYAGCASTVNSLWKADDNATSVILKQFHVYLREGYTKSKALQQAKIDYLKSDALYKSPAYWSNLVLTGNTEPLYKKKPPYGWWMIMFIIGGAVAYFGGKTILKKKKSRRF